MLLIRTARAIPGLEGGPRRPDLKGAPSACAFSVLRDVTFCRSSQLLLTRSAVRQSEAHDLTGASGAHLLFSKLQFFAFCEKLLVLDQEFVGFTLIKLYTWAAVDLDRLSCRRRAACVFIYLRAKTFLGS